MGRTGSASLPPHFRRFRSYKQLTQETLPPPGDQMEEGAAGAAGQGWAGGAWGWLVGLAAGWWLVGLAAGWWHGGMAAWHGCMEWDDGCMKRIDRFRYVRILARSLTLHSGIPPNI